MKFFKVMLASALGYIVAVVFLSLVTLLLLAGIIAASGDDTVTLKEKSILHLNFSALVERAPQNPLAELGFGPDAGIAGLNDLRRALKDAAKNEKIAGILIELPTGFSAGNAALKEAHEMLLAFKQSGKFVVAYNEIIADNTYYLAATADAVYLNPAGLMFYNGYYANVTFLKGMLEKIGVEPQIFRVGKYKSAIEPLINDRMSDENREQTKLFVETLYGTYLADIAASRGKSVNDLRAISDSMLIRRPSDAVKYGMVDSLMFYDQVIADLKNRIGLDAKKDLPFVTLAKYMKTKGLKKEETAKERIAIIYANGEIQSGEGDDETIGSARISEAIRKAREDEKVKAIVLRINSPGGDAMASDVIWRETVLAKQSKPVIVSMGNLAASGGYYIACAADTIVAQPNTITGSIGVFGVYPIMQKLLNEKLGVTFDGVGTGQFSDIGRIDRPMREDEKAIFQGLVDDIYADFISKVGEGRSMDTAAVHEIAQGRVWAGADAQKIGLVDVLGGLDTAVAIAARKAGLEKYQLKQYPVQKDFLQKLMESMGANAKNRALDEGLQKLGLSRNELERLLRIYHTRGIQARMEYNLTID